MIVSSELSPGLKWLLRIGSFFFGLIMAAVFYSETMMVKTPDYTDDMELEIRFPPADYRNQNPYVTLTNTSPYTLAQGMVVCAGFDDQDQVEQVFKTDFRGLRAGQSHDVRATFQGHAKTIRRLECRIHRTAVTGPGNNPTLHH